MSEKKWTSEDMSAAVERALQTMEGVALELYRRGREPLLEELEAVKRERDEARASCTDCAMYAERSARFAEQADRLQSERDEARAEVERVRKHYAASVLEHGKMLVEAVDSAKRQKSLADRAHDHACRLAAKLDARSADQFRRGAEAMREHCIGMACAQDLDLDAQDRMEERLRALPIPEDKP